MDMQACSTSFSESNTQLATYGAIFAAGHHVDCSRIQKPLHAGLIQMWQSYVRSGCIEKPEQQLQQPRACGERAQEPLAACRSFGCSSRFASSTWVAAAGRRMAAARWRPSARSTRAWYVVINSALWNRSRRPIANWKAAWSAFLSRNSPDVRSCPLRDATAAWRASALHRGHCRPESKSRLS